MMKALLYIFLFLAVLTSRADAQSSPIYIKVGDAKLKRSLVALPPFQFLGSPTVNPNYRSVGQELNTVFYNDLDVSSYFQFINPNAYLEDPAKVGLRPAPGEPGGFNFENWKKIGAEFLVRGGYRFEKGDLYLEAYVYYVSEAKNILAKTYKGTSKDARLIAHTFANDLIQALTGKKGYFTSKVVVSSDRSGGKSKEIFIMDWDAANFTQKTFTKNISISPNWSPDGRHIIYTTYTFHKNAKQTNTDLLSLDLITNRKYVLSWQRGVNSGGTYTPDGKNIFLSISNGDNHDIYRIDTEGKNRAQITKGKFGELNVEPCVSPDGTRVAFSSTREGSKPMIYTMNTDGSSIKRVTYAGDYNSSPNWSPVGKKIVFAGQDKTHYDIFIMNADGTGLERLTDAKKKNGRPADNEYPVFSPDGRQVLFTSNRTGTYQLYLINIDGTGERRLTFDQANYYQPKWLWK